MNIWYNYKTEIYKNHEQLDKLISLMRPKGKDSWIFECKKEKKSVYLIQNTGIENSRYYEVNKGLNRIKLADGEYIQINLFAGLNSYAKYRMQNGYLHLETAPAYELKGAYIDYKEYYLNGKRLSKGAWQWRTVKDEVVRQEIMAECLGGKDG